MAIFLGKFTAELGLAGPTKAVDYETPLMELLWCLCSKQFSLKRVELSAPACIETAHRLWKAKVFVNKSHRHDRSGRLQHRARLGVYGQFNFHMAV